MPHRVCLRCIIAGASALGIVAPVNARAQAVNTLEIVIGGGPHAGTYTPPGAQVICLHAKAAKQFSAAYKDFNARDAKRLSEAGITVVNPDETGTKRGEVRIAFGDPDKSPAVYDVVIPRDSMGPLTLAKHDKGADLTFQGQTKDGIPLRVTAACVDIETL